MNLLWWSSPALFPEGCASPCERGATQFCRGLGSRGRRRWTVPSSLWPTTSSTCVWRVPGRWPWEWPGPQPLNTARPAPSSPGPPFTSPRTPTAYNSVTPMSFSLRYYGYKLISHVDCNHISSFYVCNMRKHLKISLNFRLPALAWYPADYKMSRNPVIPTRSSVRPVANK